MMMRPNHPAGPALAVLLALLPRAAPAQTHNLQPGLWEVSSTMQSSSGAMEQAMAQAQQQMATLTPEQRKMMQDMMARQGASMGGGGPGSMAVKVCMTPEMLARNEVVTQQGDCKSQGAPRVGNTMQYSFTCTQPPSSGDGEVRFISNKAYQSTTRIKTSAGGKAESMTVQSQGRWLAADCGNIKPLGAGRP